MELFILVKYNLFLKRFMYFWADIMFLVDKRVSTNNVNPFLA